MPVPVSVYRWDDAGAPQLTPGIKPSELINVLKKVLVDGYGTKAGLGWSVAFEDAAAFKIAFRNSNAAGSGGFVQFWSSNNNDSTGSYVNFKCAKLMSALDSFTDAGFQSWIKSNQYNQINWMLIGTSAGFYFTLMNPGATYEYKQSNNAVFIGDFDPFVKNDPARFIGNTSSSDSGFTNIAGHGNAYSKIYALDGSSVSALYYTNPFFSGAENNGPYTSDDDNVTKGIAVRYVPKIIRSSGTSAGPDGNFPNNSSILPIARGIYPGLLESTFIGFKKSNFPVTRVIEGKEHLLMPGQNGGSSWVNIVEWY